MSGVRGHEAECRDRVAHAAGRLSRSLRPGAAESAQVRIADDRAGPAIARDRAAAEGTLILAGDPAAVGASAADLRSAEGAQARVADLRTGRGLARCRWDRHRLR